jgi:hypothetical protein
MISYIILISLENAVIPSRSCRGSYKVHVPIIYIHYKDTKERYKVDYVLRPG